MTHQFNGSLLHALWPLHGGQRLYHGSPESAVQETIHSVSIECGQQHPATHWAIGLNRWTFVTSASPPPNACCSKCVTQKLSRTHLFKHKTLILVWSCRSGAMVRLMQSLSGLLVGPSRRYGLDCWWVPRCPYWILLVIWVLKFLHFRQGRISSRSWLKIT